LVITVVIAVSGVAGCDADGSEFGEVGGDSA
jgi:hypothetical protein